MHILKVFKLLIILVNLEYICRMDSDSSILNISYYVTRRLIFVSLTLDVPSYVTSSLSHISLAIEHILIQLSFSLVNPQCRRVIANAFLLNSHLSSVVHSSLLLLVM